MAASREAREQHDRLRGLTMRRRRAVSASTRHVRDEVLAER
jgi:hypothetical protein